MVSRRAETSPRSPLKRRSNLPSWSIASTGRRDASLRRGIGAKARLAKFSGASSSRRASPNPIHHQHRPRRARGPVHNSRSQALADKCTPPALCRQPIGLRRRESFVLSSKFSFPRDSPLARGLYRGDIGWARWREYGGDVKIGKPLVKTRVTCKVPPLTGAALTLLETSRSPVYPG